MTPSATARTHHRALAGLVAAVALVVSAGCAPRAVSEITEAIPLVDIVAPRFEADATGTRIERFDPPGAGAGLEAALAATVRNPNEFGIVLERVEWTLLLAGERVASGVLEPDLTVPAFAGVGLTWTAAASLAGVPNLWQPVVGAFAGRPLAYEVRGRLRFVSEIYAFTSGERTLFGGDLVARQSVRAPKLTLVAGAHEATAVRPDAPVLRVAVEVTNPGDVGYFLSARGVGVALGVPRTASVDALRPVAPDEVLDVMTVGRVDLAPVPVPAGARVRTDLLVYVDPSTLTPVALQRLEAALAGVPTPFLLVGAWAYDVLGVDSFTVSDEATLFGLLGGVAR